VEHKATGRLLRELSYGGCTGTWMLC